MEATTGLRVGDAEGVRVPGPAIFLDRDGVLNENRPDHVKSWDEFRFLPGTFNALRALAALDVPIVVVTNQAVVNRGEVTQQTIDMIHRRMHSQIARTGGRIDRIYSCPHAPEERCDCRKPRPGLLLRAARDLGIDPRRSVMVGDAATDIRAGKQLGCHTILVRTGRGSPALAGFARSSADWPDEVAPDLAGAVRSISVFLEADWQRPQSMASRQRERIDERSTAADFAADLADAAFRS
jgi:D-glycero-D-manno-heptose 1,7-bisphosphate phosphatase